MSAHDTLRYCTIKGVNTSTSGGVVQFTASAADDYGISNSRGNNNNVVTYNDIRDGASTPTNGIIGNGSASLPDDTTSITNNNIYNFFSTTANFSYGIDVSGYNQSWTISGNSFYQTASRTATSSLTMTPVGISGPGIPSITVQNNSIGGSDANAGGSAFTIGPNSQLIEFFGIYVSSSSTVCTIQNNVIRNIAISTNSTDGLYAAFCGIVVGTIDTAYISGNTIGSSSGTGSITVENSANGTVKGIEGAANNGGDPGSYSIINNTIGSITCTNTSTSNRTFVYGIQISYTGELATISGNTIGSSGTPNSINYSTSSTVAYMFVRGIDCSHYGSATITNNTVANLNNNSVSTYLAGQTIGIFVNYSVQSSTISGNSIKELSTTSQDADPADVNASVLGICNQAQYGASTDSLTISNNTIDSLINTASSAAVRVAGISVSNSSPTFARNVVERNKVTNLLLSTSSTSAAITGIALQAGTATYKNNMVSIGDGLTASYVMTGILDTATTTNSYYFNTVRIGGSGVGTDATNTSAFRRAAAGTDVLKDNIFINDRSNASTGGEHYAISISSTSGLTSDYNDLYVDGTGGVLGYSSGDLSTLSNWKTGTSKDAHSVSTAVTFTSNSDLHLSGSSRTDATLDGTPISGITTDFDNDTRNATTPMMGADEYVVPLPVELANFTATANGLNAELRWSAISQENCARFDIERNEISNAQWLTVGSVTGAGTSTSPIEYSYIDRGLTAGRYSYRIKQIDNDGSARYGTPVNIEVGTAPRVFSVNQNYPNPFNPTTTIEFTIPQDGRVVLKVYDIIGREVATLVDKDTKAGVYQQVVFDGSRFSSGVYFAQIQFGGKQLIKKMLMIK